VKERGFRFVVSSSGAGGHDGNRMMSADDTDGDFGQLVRIGKGKAWRLVEARLEAIA